MCKILVDKDSCRYMPSRLGIQYALQLISYTECNHNALTKRNCSPFLVQVDRWCSGGLQDISDLPTQDAAHKINRDAVHILIDLNGWMPGHRAAVLALTPVPVQVGYKNYVGTMGAAWEPFIVTDRFCSPPEFAQDYSEHHIFMPYSFYGRKTCVVLLYPKR